MNTENNSQNATESDLYYVDRIEEARARKAEADAKRAEAENRKSNVGLIVAVIGLITLGVSFFKKDG